jgi:hypothetical protein
VNTNTSMKDVDTWKKSDIVRWCYQNIDSKKTGNDDITDDETYFEIILRKVWKKQEITSEKVAYSRAVCICVLDEHHDGVKADDKFIREKMDEILVGFALYQCNFIKDDFRLISKLTRNL